MQNKIITRKLAIRKGSIYHIKTTNDKGISRDVKKKIDNALHNTFKIFPDLKEWINEINFDSNLGSMEIARVSYFKGIIKLKLNKNLFLDEKKLINY